MNVDQSTQQKERVTKSKHENERVEEGDCFISRAIAVYLTIPETLHDAPLIQVTMTYLEKLKRGNT